MRTSISFLGKIFFSQNGGFLRVFWLVSISCNRECRNLVQSGAYGRSKSNVADFEAHA